MTDEDCEKLLTRAEQKRNQIIAAAEEEYQRIVEAVRVVRELRGVSNRLAHGSLSMAIAEAVQQLDGFFTVRDVEERLQALAPDVAERASIASISTTLRRMVDNRRLHLAEPGSATRPSKYRKAS